jgi:CHAD domain-containing protein
MAVPFPAPSNNSPSNVGLEVWMELVIERAEKARESWDADAVHDLRVALRRSRSIAGATSEVNPAPGWRKLKRSTKNLFRDLGDLRDTQVQRALVKKLAPASDPLRRQLVAAFSSAEKKQRRSAEKALDDFDRKEWKKLTKKLATKARFFPLNSVVYQRLALARLDAAAKLLQEARRRRSATAWHRLRIGIKNFRYMVENFLPQHYAAWESDLKHMQDLLGDVHDLDVLRQQVRRMTGKTKSELATQWIERIDRDRNAHLRKFLSKSSGPQSPWAAWRAGFQWGRTLAAPLEPQRRTA